MTWYLDAAITAAAAGLVTGAAVPEVVRVLPEPDHDPDEARAFGEDGPKESYAAISELPWLRWVAAAASAVVAALLGSRRGLSWELLALFPLAPVGVALFVIDVRTRFLPTRLIAPLYGVVAVVVVAAAVERGSWAPVVGAALGWAVYGGFFTLMWLLFPAGGLGFGDVRLAGLLGLALGFVSWGSWALGMFTGIVLGGLMAVALVVTRRGRHYPYGPFLLVGALVGALWGESFAEWYLGG